VNAANYGGGNNAKVKAVHMKRKDSAQSGNKTVKTKGDQSSKAMRDTTTQLKTKDISGYKNLTFKGKMLNGKPGGGPQDKQQTRN